MVAALPYHKSEQHGERTVIITQGPLPAVAYHRGELKTFPPIKCDDVLDTNGAGDAFVGGFLSQLLRDATFEKCVEAAHFAANVIIQRHGCTYPEEHNFA